ncbi:hypothetical protein FH972_021820 [Carpinus fangiana]|uniref:Prephenate/arogenate dehydrogenase domain-containing protein n=1 Tax=Carpinus fangiana TaxID=176857 RepID=A0A5N6KQE5_9ROSI|nr:hypothetical protein FH972_021820 [Carpinus fangiana]
MGKMYTRRLAAAGFRVNACDLPDKFEQLKDEFATQVCGSRFYVVLGSNELRTSQSNVHILEDGHLVSRISDWIIYNVEASSIDTVAGAIVGGQTSCKAPEIAAFHKHLPPDVDIISIHSLHGPGVDPKGQPLRDTRHSFEKVEKVMSCFGSTHVYLSAQEHDIITADTQAVTHAAFLRYPNNQFPWEIGRYLGGIENVKINLTLRIYSNKWHVYAGLAILNPSAKEQITQYAKSVTELYKLMLAGQRKELTERIYAARAAVFHDDDDSHDALLKDEVLDRFSLGERPAERVRNNHLSLLAMVDCWWKLGVVPYDHMICSTPLFRLWLGAAEYLFHNKQLLQEAIDTAIEDDTFRADDLEFTFAARDWSQRVSLKNVSASMEAYKEKFKGIAEYFEPRFAEATRVGNDMVKTILEQTNFRSACLVTETTNASRWSKLVSDSRQLRDTAAPTLRYTVTVACPENFSVAILQTCIANLQIGGLSTQCFTGQGLCFPVLADLDLWTWLNLLMSNFYRPVMTTALIVGGVDDKALDTLIQGHKTESIQVADEIWAPCTTENWTAYSTIPFVARPADSPTIHADPGTSLSGPPAIFSGLSCFHPQSEPKSLDVSPHHKTLQTEHQAMETPSSRPCVNNPLGSDRTLIFNNLPSNATMKDITNIIRGGRLIDMTLFTKDRRATVTFAEGAAEYYTYCRKNDIYIGAKRVEITWADRQFPLFPHIASKIGNGHSRNLLLCNVGRRFTEQSVRDDLEHIDKLIIVDIALEGPNMCIFTNSIHLAGFAKTCMNSRAKYKGIKIQWYPDECAQPIPTQASSTYMHMRLKKPLPPVPKSLSNRFLALKMDESAVADSDHEPDDSSSVSSGVYFSPRSAGTASP